MKVFDWLCFHIVTKWPRWLPGYVLDRRGIHRVYWSCLPYAGRWAYRNEAKEP